MANYKNDSGTGELTHSLNIKCFNRFIKTSRRTKVLAIKWTDQVSCAIGFGKGFHQIESNWRQTGYHYGARSEECKSIKFITTITGGKASKALGQFLISMCESNMWSLKTELIVHYSSDHVPTWLAICKLYQNGQSYWLIPFLSNISNENHTHWHPFLLDTFSCMLKHIYFVLTRFSTRFQHGPFIVWHYD